MNKIGLAFSSLCLILVLFLAAAVANARVAPVGDPLDDLTDGFRGEFEELAEELEEQLDDLEDCVDELEICVDLQGPGPFDDPGELLDCWTDYFKCQKIQRKQIKEAIDEFGKDFKKLLKTYLREAARENLDNQFANSEMVRQTVVDAGALTDPLAAPLTPPGE